MAAETEVERLLVRMVGDGSSYKSMIDQAVTDTKRADDGFENGQKKLGEHSRAIQGFGQSVLGYGLVIAGIAGITAGFDTLKRSISLAAEAEENEIAFGTMLQSAEKGKKMVADLQAFAAATPMDTSTLQQASKMLLQFGIEGQNVLPILKILGDVTGGNREKMLQMSLAFGQMSGTGRLMGQDLLQMINAGFNPLQVMAEKAAKTMGGTVPAQMARLKKEMEAGRISMAMVVKAFQDATESGGNFAGLMEKQSQSVSGLFSTMGDDISAVLRKLGQDIIEQLNLKQMIRDVSTVAQATMGWLSGMSAGAKGAIAAVFAATVAVGVLIAGFILLKYAITAAFGGLNLVFSAVGIAILTAVGGTTGLIVATGGVAAAWGKVKQAAQDFWDWLKPVRQAVESLWKTMEDLAFQAWEKIKGWAAAAGEWIKGKVGVDWEKIRDKVRDAVLACEFALLNFQKVAEFAWTAVKLGGVIFFAWYVHNLTTVIPAAVAWFADNFTEIVKGVWDWLVDAMAAGIINILTLFYGADWPSAWDGLEQSFKDFATRLAGNLASLVTNVALLATGKISLADIWAEKPADTAKKAAAELVKIPDLAKPKGVKPFIIPPREMSELEQRLRREFDAQGAELGESWEAFRKRKLDEFAITPDGPEAAKVIGQAGYMGAKANEAFSKGAGKKIDAALFGSVEALDRIAKYKEMVGANKPDPAAAQRAGSRSQSGNQLTVIKDGEKRHKETLDALRKIAEAVVKNSDLDLDIEDLGL